MNSHTNKKVEMCSGPILKNLIVYTVPVVLTGILQLFFNAADVIVAGRFCGSTAIAAVGATTSLTALIVNFFLGFSIGVSVTTATAAGAKDTRTLYRTIHTTITISIIGGLILMVAGLLFSGKILELMDTPAEIIGLSSLYLKIYFCGSIPHIVYAFGAAILRAVGETKSPLKYLSISGVLNVFLNVIFVVAFKMSVAGVALATVISQTLSAVLVIRNLVKRKDVCHLFISQMRIYLPQLKKILFIGFPSALQTTIFSISNVLIQSSVNSFGATTVAGNAAATNIEGFAYTAMHSFSVTAVNFVGQNRGAKNFDRIKKIVPSILGLVFVVGGVLVTFMWLFAEPLLSIYITDNPAAIAVGVIRITYFLCYPLCGILDSLTGAIRGLGNTLVPMFISISCVCGIRIVWILTIFKIPMFHTLQSLYLSYPASWIACIIGQAIAFSIIYKKAKKKDG